MGKDKALLKHHEGDSWLSHKLNILKKLDLETILLTNHQSHINEISEFHKVNILFDEKPFHGPLDCMEFLYSKFLGKYNYCLLYTSPSPRDGLLSRMPSSA